MASINYADREIAVKIVYFGIYGSGAKENLQVIHRKTQPECKSDLVSLNTEYERTMFFDYCPVDFEKIKGFSTKFQLYTTPPSVYSVITRNLVLRGADGVVFVVDSHIDKLQENLECFQILEETFSEFGYKRENVPIVIQYSKRKCPGALSIEVLQSRFNKYNLPYCEAVVENGVGVFDTFKLIGKNVVDYLNKKYSRPSRPITSPAILNSDIHSYIKNQKVNKSLSFDGNDLVSKISEIEKAGKIDSNDVTAQKQAVSVLPPHPDKVHAKFLATTPKHFYDLLDIVYKSMTDDERLKIQKDSDSGRYKVALLKHALSNLKEFGDDIARTITNSFEFGTDFIPDFLDNDNNHISNIFDPKEQKNSKTIGVHSVVLLDRDGHLVSVRKPQFNYSEKTNIVNYDHYVVLTGPNINCTYNKKDREIYEPVYVPDLIKTWLKEECLTKKNEKILQVFLCHGKEDKPQILSYYKKLGNDCFKPWLDIEDLVGGQNWDLEIKKAIKTSDAVIVFLSTQSINKSGYVQKEITNALDVAEAQPEGAIFIIPARLEECIVPERLNKYQYIDLFEKNGYEKLKKSLTLRAKQCNKD